MSEKYPNAQLPDEVIDKYRAENPCEFIFRERRPMQAKDVSEEPIIEFLRKIAPDWGCSFGTWAPNSVFHAMPEGTPHKVGLAKMKSLIKRGKVFGCACGCRGDYSLEK